MLRVDEKFRRPISCIFQLDSNAWFFFLTVYPRKRKGDYPNDPISEWCRQLPYQELNCVQNIPSVHPVNDIYSPPAPPNPKAKQQQKNL